VGSRLQGHSLGMEKLKIGLEMSTRCTDPPMMLMGIIPYAVGCVGVTGYSASQLLREVAKVNFSASGIAELVQADKGKFGWLLAGVLGPYVGTQIWWRTCYHSWGAEPGVDTTKYIRWTDGKDGKEGALGRYYKNRRIPMCDLYEHYIEGKFDWNEECEGGDCYLILEKHRDHFVNYKTTWNQIWWLICQFLPWWMTGAGLGTGSSSGKSIAETTKEIDEHYNKGNDVFSAMLGVPMVYTCGIFHEMPKFASDGYKGDYAKSAADGALEEAQHNKLQMVCDKLMLQEGESFLDIGCGWGTLIRHAAKFYGAKATGVTLAVEGKKFCDDASKETGVPTDILFCDYRDIPAEIKFDKIASIEMAEHVGIANFVDPYLSSVRRLMKRPDSSFLLQVSGLRQGANWQDVAWGLFMSKYIFPGADASTPLNWYVKQCELAGFEVHSVETIGRHYAHTLHKWYDNWMSHKDKILSGKIDAISHHTTGKHLFRLQEFFLAWSVIAAGQGSATCYQLVCHPNTYDYPRDQWVDKSQVSGPHLVGVGLQNGDSPLQKPNSKADAVRPVAKRVAAMKAISVKNSLHQY